MSSTVISVENLGKKYTIGRNGAGTDGLRHAIHDFVAAPFRRLSRPTPDTRHLTPALTSDFRPLTSGSEDFWALKDVSFEVKQGEVVGIIGRNGAGKSTLLKILSRITEPTTGRLRIRGRIASLLEVGTGFHPELTGRENVFLNGAILGMSRAEVKRKFDEIVAFAEVEQFLNTPVKRYSSGMYVRLAFAVAAHLEPEILIIDEVLAVGDAEFQKKCLGKMSEVGEEGRTVLFVSHTMTAIRTLCSRGIVLDRGQTEFDGNTSDAINFYSVNSILSNRSTWSRPSEQAGGPLVFEEICSTLGGVQPELKLVCDISLRCNEVCEPAFVAVDICDQLLSPIMQAVPETVPFIEGLPGVHKIRLEIHLPPLVPGLYGADFWVGPHYTSTMDQVRHSIVFEIVESPSNNRSFPHTSDHGCMVPPSKYTYTFLNSEAASPATR